VCKTCPSHGRHLRRGKVRRGVKNKGSRCRSETRCRNKRGSLDAKNPPSLPMKETSGGKSKSLFPERVSMAQGKENGGLKKGRTQRKKEGGKERKEKG